MTECDEGEWTQLGLHELLHAARALTAELTSRVVDPGFVDVVEWFPDGPEVDRSGEGGLSDLACPMAGSGATGEGVPVPDGSLPVIQLQVEETARQVEAARTALAGHVDQVFNEPVRRREVLGIPEGKSTYRSSAEYLCHHLRIRRVEARRRIRRAGLVMERRSMDQVHVLPPAMPVLAGVVHEGQADIASVDIIVDTLVSARKDAALAGAEPRLVDGLVADGERVLAAQVKDTDPDTVKKACIYWRQRFDALANPDGVEPTEAQAKAAQGLFYHGRGPANLHEWSLLAGDGQHEILKTIASAASSHRRNPTTPPAVIGTSEDRNGPAEEAGESGPAGRTQSAENWVRAADAADALDNRSRGQRELDGLISALVGALSLTAQGVGVPGPGTVPDATEAPAPAGSPGRAEVAEEVRPDAGGGGARPQVLVTIDYQSLAGQLEEAVSTGNLISQAAYTGPVTPQTVRQMACDADLIPVVLGGKGEVLDVGRAHRLFPRRLRRAITARDGGCAAPSCSIPAPWCEAHHIEHWENGGPTSVDNGVLLCSHHHHAVHAGSWEISVRDGIPWFIPAPHHDPERRPRRNRYWRPGALDEAA